MGALLHKRNFSINLLSGSDQHFDFLDFLELHGFLSQLHTYVASIGADLDSREQ